MTYSSLHKVGLFALMILGLSPVHAKAPQPVKPKPTQEMILRIPASYFEKIELQKDDDRALPGLEWTEQDHLAATLLTYSADHGKNDVLSEHASDELNLVAGKPECPQMSLANRIGRYVNTIYGHEAMRYLLTHPLNNKQEQKLLNRQKFVQRLAQSPELLTEFENVFQPIAQQQEDMLILWSLSNPFNSRTDALTNFTNMTGSSNSATTIEGIRTAMLLSLSAATGVFIGYGAKCGYDVIQDHFQGKDFNGKNGAWGAASFASAGLLIWKVWPGLIAQERLNKSMQELMISVANTINSAQEVNELLKKVPSAVDALEYHNDLVSFAENSDKLSKEMRFLLKELNTSTFKNNASYFSFMGRVRVAYERATRLKEQLVPLLKSIGEIDAYISVARMIRTHDENDARYCFTTFVTEECPRLEVEKVWNPVVHSDKIIPEDVKLGSGKDAVANILLTGPHGGGKSTFMRELAYTVLLSQVFGVAPATACTMTVFNSLNTYMDIKDNAEEGMSTFMVEGDRADELKRRLRRLHDDHFGFTIMDEGFKGTMEAEASKLLIKFGQKIGNITESICILATHFVEPAIELETGEDSRFKNFHMKTDEYSPGRFKRYFKLIKGRCDWWFNDPAKRGRYVKWLQTSV
ncbi:MAG: hypothetical protein H6679_00915 [Epsilonproteobacteria bacterium]|nr:hypothetical protein [Campylobacterota bacterium]